MANRGEILLNELAQRVEDFVFDHNTYPNAVIISYEDLAIVACIDRLKIKARLPTVMSLIPAQDPFAFDLPMPVLLPVVATKLQREQAIVLENRNL
jgi:hypothetical protein